MKFMKEAINLAHGLRQSKGSSRDYVYHIIKENILKMKLEPGTLISEKEISEKLQVSRTPTREAFIKLSEEDLIVIYPQKGSYVSQIDLDQAVEARFVRENLEVAVIKIACDTFNERDLVDLEVIVEKQRKYSDENDYAKLQELDEEFHRTIFEKCGKQRTFSVIQQMHVHYRRIRFLLLAVYFDWKAIIRQHEQIIEFIRQRNFASAEKEMRDHLQYFLIDDEKLMQKYPTYFKRGEHAVEIHF